MLPAIVAIAAALLARTSLAATIHLAPRFGTATTTTAAAHNEVPRGRGGDEATPRLAAGGEPSSSAPLASIDSGVLRGTVEIAADGSKMNSFRGVPYGEPPVNAVRTALVPPFHLHLRSPPPAPPPPPPPLTHTHTRTPSPPHSAVGKRSSATRRGLANASLIATPQAARKSARSRTRTAPARRARTACTSTSLPPP